jgi:hypothetical protein
MDEAAVGGTLSATGRHCDRGFICARRQRQGSRIVRLRGTVEIVESARNTTTT